MFDCMVINKVSFTPSFILTYFTTSVLVFYIALSLNNVSMDFRMLKSVFDRYSVSLNTENPQGLGRCPPRLCP